MTLTRTPDTWRDLSDWDKARLRWLLRTRTPDPRPNQVTPDGDWLIWLILAGRGFGKTRMAAEDISDYARRNPGQRIAVVTDTFAEARDVCVEGKSGLLSVLPDSALRGGSRSSAWNRSLGELILANGAQVKVHTAEKPDGIRGYQYHRVWCDELAKWRYLQETWDQIQLATRLPTHLTQFVITTTPRPLPLLRDLRERERTVTTTGSTFDNAANLSASALDELRRRYEGSRLGRQELYGELLEDLGFVFDRRWFDLADESPAGPGWQRIRYWDLAGTPGSEIPGQAGDFAAEDPDWTAGVLLAWEPRSRHLVIEDMRHVRRSPGEVERLVLATAEADGHGVTVWIEEEPGQSGKAQVATYDRLLPGHLVKGDRPSGPKLVRAQLLAQLAEQGTQEPPAGRVTILAGRPWTQHLLDELEVFTGESRGAHDDMVDACSGGLKVLSTGPAPGGGTSADVMASLGPMRRR